MPHPTGPTDPNTTELIRKMRAKKEKFYLLLARQLEKPMRSKTPVNVTKIERTAAKDDVIAVPGRVLGAGQISKPVTVYAVHFSKDARNKIVKAGGKCMPLAELDGKARMLI